VATLTADPFVDMNAVIEIDEIRQIVYACPINRGVVAETGTHRLQSGASDPNLRMTVHTSLGGRNVRKAGGFHGGMAVTTINPKTADVMCVAERHRLLPGLCGSSRIVRAAQLGEGPTQEGENEHGAEDGDPRERVCTTTKQLRHNKDNRADLSPATIPSNQDCRARDSLSIARLRDLEHLQPSSAVGTVFLTVPQGVTLTRSSGRWIAITQMIAVLINLNLTVDRRFGNRPSITSDRTPVNGHGGGGGGKTAAEGLSGSRDGTRSLKSHHLLTMVRVAI
jgi:hypothetical protein